mmetsp:Transcript_49410/g.139955  ORF Transcript_49410/g.139955 Transcript_49410/m.139955 type:complete len:200 (+) Transcript_49410:1993-2592(+)
MARPLASSRRVKSRTTHRKAGKCSARPSFSVCPVPLAPPPPPPALLAASERTWICFVRLTTRPKSSRAPPSITPRLFQMKKEESSTASEKICVSSVCVREVEPRPSLSTKRTFSPSGSVSGRPQSQRPFVQACTVLPTTKLSGLPLSPRSELSKKDLPVRHLPATAITASGEGMAFNISTASSWTVYRPLSSEVISGIA